MEEDDEDKMPDFQPWNRLKPTTMADAISTVEDQLVEAILRASNDRRSRDEVKHKDGNIAALHSDLMALKEMWKARVEHAVRG